MEFTKIINRDIKGLDIGMARGIPRPSMSRTFFHSSIPRGIDFITPRLLESSQKYSEDLEILNTVESRFKKDLGSDQNLS